MKRTDPQSAGDILREMMAEDDFLKLVREHDELRKLWETLPDPTFSRLSVEIQLSTDGLLVVICPSAVALNYVRLRRSMIEQHLAAFMTEYRIETLQIRLATHPSA